MSQYKPLTVLIVASVVLSGFGGIAMAHSWATTVEQGPMELGVSSTPGTPKAGMQTEFSARIADAQASGDSNRTSWGGVTNKSVSIHVHGPAGIHDHIETEIPADGAHFHWSYVFPEAGNYTMNVVTTIEGQEYAFQYQKQVTLLPAEAKGQAIENLSEDVAALQATVSDLEAQNGELKTTLEAVQTQNEELKTTLEAIKKQNEELHAKLEQAGTGDGHGHETTAASHGDTGTPEAKAAGTSGPGFGIVAALGALVVGLAVVTLRRR